MHNAFDSSCVDTTATRSMRASTNWSRQLAAATEHIQSLAARLAEEQRRAERAERQARETPRSDAAQPAAAEEPGQGFGYRAERLLRMAEAEANDLRATAIKEAAEIVEQRPRRRPRRTGTRSSRI